jgi:Flp pilus assembly protein TadD
VERGPDAVAFHQHAVSRAPARSAAGFPRSLIDGELARIVESRAFRSSPRHQQFLRHLVERAVTGHTGSLKEAVLALEVFKRPLHSFDPERDTIVRVEARRLRQRLDRYYEDEGGDAVLEFRLPVGSYVPTLKWRTPPDDAETRLARDLCERGEHYLRQPLSRATLETALDRFEAALRESPRYVPALVGVGRSWFNLASGWHREPGPASEHATEALRRALDLDPSNAVAHTLLGAIRHQYDYDWSGARECFERAVALEPHASFVHSAYGYHLLVRGEFEAAESEIALARRLDPQYANARMHMVNLRIAQGRLDDAEAELAAMSDIAPESAPVAGLAAVIAMIRGDAHAAMAHYVRACELGPEYPNCYASLAAAQGMAGRVHDADATIARMRERFGERCVSPYVLAIVALRCGRSSEAFALLEQAIRTRDPNVMLLRTDPSFRDLRRDPRWAPMEAQIGPRDNEA